MISNEGRQASELAAERQRAGKHQNNTEKEAQEGTRWQDPNDGSHLVWLKQGQHSEPTGSPCSLASRTGDGG